MMFKLLRLEDRIVLDGAAPGEVLKQSSFADLDHDDTFSAFQHNRSAFENDISEPLLTADAIGAETYPDETNILLISSDIADDDVLSGAVADDVILIRYNAGETDLKDLSSLINDALAGKKADSIGFALHSSDAGLQLTRGENVSAQSLTQDIDHLSFWQDIGDMLADGGRIDLLSCNIAGTAEGDALLAALEDISGKNVAASDDASGNAPDGDWILESANIDAAKIYFDADALADFEGLLAVPEQNNPYPSDFGGSSGFLMNEGAEINYPLFSHFRDPADPAATLVFENVSKMAVEPFMGDTGWLTLTTDGYLQGTVPGTSGDATVYEYTIGFDVKSGTDTLAGQSFTLKDGNTAPALDGITALPDLEITQGAAFSASLVDYFNDAETGKNLFFTDNNPPGGDTSWLTFNSDGTVSGTVPNDGVKYTLNFTVSDGLGGTVTESLTLQTANTAPYPTGALPTIDIT
ncbi:MAG: DUF4347 domain-containing protein, partial [Desulfococcaceae bacterium]|nr:DUF4347 domain-containing protein [Desulfococcaceae bacterium]